MIRKQVGHSLQPATPQVRIKLSYVKLAEITEIGIQSVWPLYEHYIQRHQALMASQGFQQMILRTAQDQKEFQQQKDLPFGVKWRAGW